MTRRALFTRLFGAWCARGVLRKSLTTAPIGVQPEQFTGLAVSPAGGPDNTSLWCIRWTESDAFVIEPMTCRATVTDQP